MRSWQFVLGLGAAACALSCASGKGDHPVDATPILDGPPIDAEQIVDSPRPIDAVMTDACPASNEICDGSDNDCDGKIDEGFPVGQACSVGLGACATAGEFACTGSATFACDAVAGTPTPEVCGDGVDQDCSGGDAACPANDRATGAIDISAGGTFTVNLAAAHDDDQGTCGGSGGRDVFYEFALPAAEVVYLDSVGSTFDSTLHLMAGACTATTTNLACGSHVCGGMGGQLALQLAAGTYCVVLDQIANNDTATANGPGSGVLHMVRGGRTGTLIAATSGSMTGNTATGGATNQTSPEATCEANSAQPDDGYFFTSCPGQTYTVGASTCGDGSGSGDLKDSIIYLRSGGAKHTPSDKCDDDSCEVNATVGPFTSEFTGAKVTGPNLHWLVVDGFGTGASGKGAYTLTYTIQ